MQDKEELPSLDELESRIRDVREKHEPEPSSAEESGKGRVWRDGSELIAGIAVGGYLGYLLDGWLDISPAFTVTGILLGMAAGAMNIYRAASQEAQDQPEVPEDKPSRTSDE